MTIEPHGHDMVTHAELAEVVRKLQSQVDFIVRHLERYPQKTNVSHVVFDTDGAPVTFTGQGTWVFDGNRIQYVSRKDNISE
jgi:hypothetical protein